MDFFQKISVHLVVDDFEVMRNVTVRQLRTLGADTILTAKNGVEALRILRQEHVDLVLSDLNMPVMSGLELLKAIRADEHLRRLPFLMITSEYDRQVIQAVIDAGVNSLLLKPYTPQRLAAHIQKTIACQHHQEEEEQFQAQASAILQAQPVTSTSTSESASYFAQSEPSCTDVTLPKDSRLSILIVDDLVANQLLLSRLFNNNYFVRTVDSGEGALSICSSDTPPDLVLLDIMMPGMDGFEVARRMREYPGSENIPIIFVSAMTDNATQLKCMSLGAVDFVSKPIDLKLLRLRVSNFMRYVEMHKQLQTAYDDMLELSRTRDVVDQITRHDLRGPLAGALGLVQEMASDDVPIINPKVHLRLVEDTVLQVLNMINLSAEIFKIETGRFQLQPQPIQIGDILQRIVQMASVTFSEKKLVMKAQTDAQTNGKPVQALGDALFCYSLFQNLVKNACEAAPFQSQVVVSLSNTDPLRILIQNSGVVPAEIRPRFFEKFTSKKTSGSGLGTYSAKLLTEAQGGQITLDVSDNDNTTSLGVTLPRVLS